MKTKSIRHFTLVELLTVVVVMTIIGSITIPLYNRLMTGSAVSYANRLINSQLNMARVHACSRREYVAVIFLDYSLSANYVTEESVALRTFRSAYVEYNETSSAWKFVKWVENSKWEFLPKGAFFPTTDATQPEAKDNTTDTGFLASAQVVGVYDGIVDPDSTKDVVKPEDDTRSGLNDLLFKGKRAVSMAIIFQPNGRPIIGSNGKVQVQVREGVVASNTNEAGLVVKYNVDNYMLSKVNRYTGEIKTKALEIE